MKTIVSRIKKLEQRVCRREDEQSLRAAQMLWEKRRQRALAEGIPFTGRRPEAGPRGPRETAAETLRRKRAEHRAHQERLTGARYYAGEE